MFPRNLSTGPGGGLSTGPGGGMSNGPCRYISNMPPWHIFLEELIKRGYYNEARMIKRSLIRNNYPSQFLKTSLIESIE